MRTSAHLLAAAATLCLTATGSSAMPMSSGALKSALDATNLVEQSALFVFEGRPYCFYFDGWHGPGWYRCGFAWRRGFGWGGVYGWQGWDYGPAARRFGRGHGDFRFREGRGDRDFRDGRRGGTTTFQERSTTRGDANMRGQFQPRNEGRQGRSDRSSGFSERSGGSMRMQAAPRGGEFRGNAPTTSGQGGAQLRSGGGAPAGGGAQMQMRSGGGGGAPGGGAPGGGGHGGGGHGGGGPGDRK
jgi:hypothetical protein